MYIHFLSTLFLVDIYDDDYIDTIKNKNYLRIVMVFRNDTLTFETLNDFNEDYHYK